MIHSVKVSGRVGGERATFDLYPVEDDPDSFHLWNEGRQITLSLVDLNAAMMAIAQSRSDPSKGSRDVEGGSKGEGKEWDTFAPFTPGV